MTNQPTPANEPTAEEILNRIEDDEDSSEWVLSFEAALRAMYRYADQQTVKLIKERTELLASIEQRHKSIPPDFWERLQIFVNNSPAPQTDRVYLLTICKNNIKP